jgi:hypothetical protein
VLAGYQLAALRIASMSSSEEFLDKSSRIFKPDEAVMLLLIAETLKNSCNQQSTT